MVCKECGKLLRETRTECSYCGAPQPLAVPIVKKKIKWGWVAAAAVLAVGAAILVVLLLR